MRIRVKVDGDNELANPLMVSVSIHIVLFGMLLFSPPPGRGDAWGGPGAGAIQVSLVGNLQGVPLPRPEVVTDSEVATESPGLFREEPDAGKSTDRTVPENSGAEEIPDFQNNRRRRSSSIPRAPSRGDATPNPPGTVPFGEGGPPSLPYSNFAAQAGGVGAAIGAGAGFGGRYAWYVEGVNRRISGNWLVSAVDPYVQWAPRVEFTFDILRDGSIVNVQMVKSSGVASVDRSTLRAIRESSPLPALPTDYSGRRVSVNFYFDFQRK